MILSPYSLDMLTWVLTAFGVMFIVLVLGRIIGFVVAHAISVPPGEDV